MKLLAAVLVAIIVFIVLHQTCSSRGTPMPSRGCCGAKPAPKSATPATSAASADSKEAPVESMTDGEYGQFLIDGLEDKIKEGHRQFVKDYDTTKNPGSSSRIATQMQVNEPSLPLGSFIGMRRPTAVKKQFAGLQDPDTPDDLYETKSKSWR